MEAAILTIGTELLKPGRTDTNSGYLIERLASVGIPVIHRATVGDDRRMLEQVARQAWERADVVIATGGLGPTSDDLTRESVAAALGLELHLDRSVLELIRLRFEKRGLSMPNVNRKQAMVPEGSRVLPNPVGTAPGLWIHVPTEKTVGGGNPREVVLLPGPPVELRPMFEEQVLPDLARLAAGTVYRTKKLFITGLPESAVEERVGEIYEAVQNPSTTILASAGQVEIHLTASGQNGAEADAANEALAARLREVLGVRIFTETAESLEQVVGSYLVEAKLTLAVAESCTGGLIMHRLTEVSGSSRYFERGFVTYSNASKAQELGVGEDLIREHGAVSEEVASAMARGARERSAAKLGLSVTGIAGPAGGTPRKPVGLVYIGLSTVEETFVRRLQIPGDRSYVKWWSSQAALDFLRLHLIRRRWEASG